MNNVIFIVGPTATGKSELAYTLALKTGGEIVSCDSMLIYKEPSIITSKPPQYMLDEAAHHFIDIISVKDNYDVFRYSQDARAVISGLLEKEKPVIICGGSGLYVQALLDGIFKDGASDAEIRSQLAEEVNEEGLASLYARLKKVDPAAAEKISGNDARRIIRALEVYYVTGKTISQKQKEKTGLWQKVPLRIFGLHMERPKLYERINARVDSMFASGAISEVQQLLKLPLSLTAQKIIGIPEIKKFLEGECSEDEAREQMKKNTRHFAKRQLTWFRRDNRIEWVDVTVTAPETAANQIYSKIHSI
jgi:tRNA dimethylallyltransferase